MLGVLAFGLTTWGIQVTGMCFECIPTATPERQAVFDARRSRLELEPPPGWCLAELINDAGFVSAYEWRECLEQN